MPTSNVIKYSQIQQTFCRLMPAKIDDPVGLRLVHTSKLQKYAHMLSQNDLKIYAHFKCHNWRRPYNNGYFCIQNEHMYS